MRHCYRYQGRHRTVLWVAKKIGVHYRKLFDRVRRLRKLGLEPDAALREAAKALGGSK